MSEFHCERFDFGRDEKCEQQCGDCQWMQIKLHQLITEWQGEQLKCGNSNPPCAPNIKFGYLECTECDWSE